MLRVVKSDILLKRRQQVSLKTDILNNLNTLSKERLYSLLCLFLLCFFSSTSSAQSISTPLSSSRVIQDNQGFIWFATTNGLVRNDAHKTIVFNNSNSDWPLPFNWINDIEYIADDTLLLATETHGLWRFNTSTGTASQLNVKIHRKSIYQVRHHQQFFYIDAPNKLYRINQHTLDSELLANNIDIKQLAVTKKAVYVATSDSVFQVEGLVLKKIATGSISAIEARGDYLVIAHADRIDLINEKNTQTLSIPLNNEVYALTIANNEQSFFSVDTQGKISQYYLKTLKEIPHNYGNSNNTFTENIFHDRTGVLWLLTNQGTQQISPSKSKNHQRIFDVIINAISLAKFKGRIIIGSYGEGIHELNEKNTIFPKNVNAQLTSRAKIITDMHAVENDLFITTFDGLWRYNALSKQLNRVNFPNNNKILLNITRHQNSLVLSASKNGTYLYNLKTKQLAHKIDNEILKGREAIDTLITDNGNTWVATSAGISIIDSKTQNITHVEKYGENKVTALIANREKIFAATKGDGIFIYNQQGELLSQVAKSIAFSKMAFIGDEIWLSGKPGLYRFDPETYQIKMVPNTKRYSFTRTPVLLNRTVYAGHYGGVLEVALSSSNTHHSDIHISKTIATGKAHLLSKDIKINSSNDVITLELASLDFRPGQEKHFKYQINGGNWHDINGNQLTLTGLSSGDYQIEIMGTNSLGQWSNMKAYADISVAYPWYWTPHIRIIYFVLALSIVTLVSWLLYLRSRSISHVHQLLNDEIKTHGKAALVIHRKLQKIQTIMSDSFQNQEIQNLVNECVDELSLQNSSNEPSSLSGSSLDVALPYLSDYVYRKYHVNITTTLEIDCENVAYTIQNAIYRIIYEAILGAISYSNSAVFKVHLHQANDKIWLKLTDNEQSFAQFNSKIKFNMATYYIRQVANTFNATFQTYDNDDNGSEIIISIPMMKIS